MPAKQLFDVCVVGSGPGGGIATYVLAKAGLKVALVESGPRLRPGVDFNAHAQPYAHLHQPRAVGSYSDRNHFTPVGDRPAHGLLRALGGRSLCWAGHSLRFGPLDFRRWPISYDQLAPFYRRVELFMGVHGNRDRLWNLPDGEFQQPVPLRCGEMMLKRGVERLKRQGRRMEFIAQRKAILTQPHSSRRPLCHYCGHCMAGCEVDAKYTSANTAIPLALKTGNLTLLLQSTMVRIRTGHAAARVTGIDYITAAGELHSLDARALVLACSAVETARHLLHNQLANSSGQVGKNLTSHFGVTVTGIFPELAARDASNDDGTDYYHSLLTGLYWDQPNPNFDGTYQVQCGAGLHPRRLAVRNVPGWGAQFKRDLREWNASHASMGMQGTLLASPRKFIDLDLERKDRFGIPLPRIHLYYEDSDIAMARDMVATCHDIIQAAGGRVISSPNTVTAANLIIDSNHWVGTTRMGVDARHSVVNTECRAHDHPNLFIADASVFPAYPEKNPTLTNMALAWRTAELLAKRFRRREI